MVRNVYMFDKDLYFRSLSIFSVTELFIPLKLVIWRFEGCGLVYRVYECNSRCACSARCHNRVAQNGLQMRLQVFKTEKRGWGLRCLDDIPMGGFVCIYAGQLLTEQAANEVFPTSTVSSFIL